MINSAVSVTMAGAVGDGLTDDTAAVQRALNTGNEHIRFPDGTYLVDALTIPPSVRRIDGPGTLKQRTAGQNVLRAIGVTNLTIEGIAILGVGGDFFTVTDTAIKLTNCIGIVIRGVTVTDMRTHAVHMVGCSFADISGMQVTGCTGGVRCTGSDHFRVHHNSFRSPNYTAFTVVIGVDSINESPHVVPADYSIDHNLIENYIAAQAVLSHAGIRGVIVANVCNDVLQGCSFQPYMVGDVLQDCVIANNTIVQTTTVAVPPMTSAEGNYGIYYGGGSSAGGTQDAGKVWQVDASPLAYTDITADANDGGVGDFVPFPAVEAIGDYVAFGFSIPFNWLTFNYAGGTAGIGGVVVWEYWNGAAWVALADVTDATNGFTAAAANGLEVRFTAPSPFLQWPASVINGSASLYWVRARVTTVYSTNPALNQVRVVGEYRAERGLVSDNRIWKANAVVAAAGHGGIVTGYSDDLVIQGNAIVDAHAAGISIGNPCTRLVVRANNVRNVVDAGGTRVGIYVHNGNPGTYSGRIEGNRVEGAQYGARFDQPSTFVVGRNDWDPPLVTDNPVVGLTNATTDELKELAFLNETGLSVLKPLRSFFSGGFDYLRIGGSTAPDGFEYDNVDLCGGGVLGFRQNSTSVQMFLPLSTTSGILDAGAHENDQRVDFGHAHYFRVAGTIELLIDGTTVSIPTNNLSVAAGTITAAGAITSTVGTSAFVGVNISGLTASQAVVTDGSKNLSSLAYAQAATASALVQRTAAGNGVFTGIDFTGVLSSSADIDIRAAGGSAHYWRIGGTIYGSMSTTILNGPGIFHTASGTDAKYRNASNGPAAQASRLEACTGGSTWQTCFRAQNVASGNCSAHIGVDNDADVFVCSASGKLSYFGGTARAKQAVTGALSTVTDAAAKAVLTSLIAALSAATGYNLLTDSTT